MRCNKNVKKLVILLLLLFPLLGMAEKRKVTYFSPSSFYVYSMASWIHNVPSYYYGYKDSAAAPLLGLGYTVVNFGDKMLLNLEFDISTAEFDFAQVEPTRIWFYSFLFNGEYRLPHRSPLGFYLGFGGTVFDYDSVEGSEFVLTFNVGVKVRLAKRLMLRVELRHHWQGTGDNYWYDEWEYYGDEVDSDPFGTAIAAGVEFHF